MQAEGHFAIEFAPQPPEAEAGLANIGRMRLDKQYSGAIAGRSHGQMLAFRSATEGSAGYVAIEQVTGSLNGRQGSFVLQHSSLMERGTPRQSITVIPDSGTGQLTGLSGELRIEVSDGQHRYVFDYDLPA